MKKLLLILALLMFQTIISRSQWVSNYSGNSIGDVNNLANAKGLGVTADSSGNCYVTGFVYNDLTGNDIVVIKYSPAGDTVWTRAYNGTANSDDQGTGIAVDNSGNVYVTGTVSMAGASYNVVLLKYDVSGSFQWARTYSGNTNGENRGLALLLDINGNIYLTGFCTNLAGHTGIITQKYDGNGNPLWSKEEHGPDSLDAKGFGIAADHMGNILVTGYCNTNAHGIDIIVVKYDGNGNRLWSRTYNGPANGEDRAFGIAVDLSDKIYVTGYVTTDLNINNTDCVLLKYNSNGDSIWSRTYNGLGNSQDKAFGLAVDAADGSIYITGYTTGVSDSTDYVTIKYAPDGTQQWAMSYNGPGNGDDRANAIALLGTGSTASVIVTGQSMGTGINHDYATIKYNAAGQQIQASRYSMCGNSDNIAKSIATKGTSVFVTGFSTLIINSRSAQSSISTLKLNWGSKSELNTLTDVPKAYNLSQNYPNPFNPSTTIKFNIIKASNVKLVIYDILGKVVTTLVNQYMNAGSYNIIFNTPNLASGVYFYELSAGTFRDIKKMTLVK